MASTIDINQHRLFLAMLDGDQMVSESSKAPSGMQLQGKTFTSYSESSRIYEPRYVKVHKSALRILKSTEQALAAYNPTEVKSKQLHFSLARDKVMLMLSKTNQSGKIEKDLERVMNTIAFVNGIKNVSTPVRSKKVVRRPARRRRVEAPTTGMSTKSSVKTGILPAPTFGGRHGPGEETTVVTGGVGAAMAGDTASRQVGRLLASSSTTTSGTRGARVPLAFFQRGKIKENMALIDRICAENPSKAELIRAEINSSDLFSVEILKNSMSFHHSTIEREYTRRIDFNTSGGSRKVETRVGADSAKLVAARAALRPTAGRAPLGEVTADNS